MRAIAQAQPNIALIKYWGKRDIKRNLPAVGSMSLTLESLWTKMTVRFSPEIEHDWLAVNGETADEMLPRVVRCLDQVAGKQRHFATIESDCNFPIAAGLASSAAAFAALVTAASSACRKSSDRLILARAAGVASGSAARSLFGGIVELESGDDEINVLALAEPDDWPLRVVVAVTAGGTKPVSSGDAMILSEKTSPFYSSWVANQEDDLDVARCAVQARNFEQLAAVSEHNCLKMHSVMWTSRPPVVYWNKATLACMETIRALQDEGQAVFFTIDAGPQLKAICLPENEALVAATLGAVDGVEAIMTTGLGPGAQLLDDA